MNSMTTNTLAAIRERADDGYELWFDAFDNCCQIDQQVYTDIASLLAIVDELTARAEAAEAALATLSAQVHKIRYAGDVKIDGEEIRYGLHCEWSQVRLTALMAVGTLATIEAADALAAHDANGENAGNGGA